jgi:hypothetical protein
MLTEAISLAVQLCCHRPDLSDQDIMSELVSTDIAPLIAARIVEFVPSAFARLLLGPTGVRFSPSFVRQSAEGVSVEQRLDSEPVWAEINSFAATGGKKLGRAEWLAIAGRSAEFEAVNRLLNSGSSPHDIVLAPLSFQWPVEGPI